MQLRFRHVAIMQCAISRQLRPWMIKNRLSTVEWVIAQSRHSSVNWYRSLIVTDADCGKMNIPIAPTKQSIERSAALSSLAGCEHKNLMKRLTKWKGSSFNGWYIYGVGKCAASERKARLSPETFQWNKFSKVSVKASTQLSAANFNHLHPSFRFMKFSSKNHWFTKSFFFLIFASILKAIRFSALNYFVSCIRKLLDTPARKGRWRTQKLTEEFAIKDSFQMGKVSCLPQRKLGKDIWDYSFNFLRLMV